MFTTQTKTSSIVVPFLERGEEVDKQILIDDPN